MKITDETRLDFVRKFGVGKMAAHGPVEGFFWPDQNCTRFGGYSFRQAIDAAIRAEKAKRRKA